MCGILAIFNSPTPVRQKTLQSAQKLRHRGPDASGIYDGKDKDNKYWSIAHERLAIMDPISGAQPFKSDKNTILAVNGEIYNYNDLKTYKEKTNSDCEVIITQYDNSMSIDSLFHSLDGVYAFVLYNTQTNDIIVTRDRVGVMPLYYGYGYDGSIAFASEMKALEGLVGCVSIFPPGYKYNGKTFEPIKDLELTSNDFLSTSDWVFSNIPVSIYQKLYEATRKRVMSDVPWGVLLSGGLDSSIIGYIASKISKTPIQTFCIGLEGSEDCEAAQKMANAIHSNHTSFTFTKEEGWDAIRDVIYHLETYDVTTIRAGTPMFLLARKIRAMGIKMVLSGEGSDEMFGGYLYFHNAPSDEAFQEECFDKIKALHQYDCLRANKAMAAFGIECRVPFLDIHFLNFVMKNVPPSIRRPKNNVEKHILRESFNHTTIPKEILKRQKEQFSDGVGYGWIDYIKTKTKKYSFIMKKAAKFFPINTPQTEEAFYYRTVFEEFFHNQGAIKTVPYEKTCACSTGKAYLWKGNQINDASGRSVDIHKNNNI